MIQEKRKQIKKKIERELDMNCLYCGKECNRVAFVEETGMALDFPMCNDICLKKYRLEQGYDKPKLDWEIDFVCLLKEKKIIELKKEMEEELKLIESELRYLKSRISKN